MTYLNALLSFQIASQLDSKPFKRVIAFWLVEENQKAINRLKTF